VKYPVSENVLLVAEVRGITARLVLADRKAKFKSLQRRSAEEHLNAQHAEAWSRRTTAADHTSVTPVI